MGGATQKSKGFQLGAIHIKGNFVLEFFVLEIFYMFLKILSHHLPDSKVTTKQNFALLV